MIQRELTKSYNSQVNFKYQIWRLDEALKRAVWRRDQRCCRCNAVVSLPNARVARITNSNNLENRFNLNLAALCCPYCEEYCIIETEYALVSISLRSQDFFKSVKRKQLRFEELTVSKLAEYRKNLKAQIKEERDFQKNLLEDCREMMK